MALASRSYHWLPSSDGTYDGHYPQGDKPTGGLTTWLLSLNLTNLTTGTPFSQNVRSTLSGANAATAIITVETVSGDNATSEGWAISSAGAGNNLTHPGSQTGAGFLRLRATDGGTGQSITVGPFSWNYVAATGSDTLAPTIPTGFKVTPINGGVTIEHDASSDPFDGALLAALVKDYRVRKNGTVIQTQTSGVLPGISPTFALTNIGAISSPAAPTALQSGAQWTLTAAGTGVHGTQSDQCAFLGSDFSGDFTVIAKLESFTSAHPYSTSGIMIRESTALNAPFVALYVQPSTPGYGLQVKRRATSTTNSSNRASVAGVNAAYVRLKRVGVNVIASYSTDGGAWTDIITVSDAPMASAVKGGAFLSSQLAGTNCSSVVSQLSVNNAPALSYDVTTTGTGTFTVSCRDNAGTPNESAVSLAIVATPLVVTPPAFTHRFKPGHHGFFTKGFLNPSTSTGLTNQTALFSFIDTLAASGHTQIKGVQLMIPWKELEGPTQGSYARAWNVLDPIFAKLAAVTPAKNLILQIWERGFGNSDAALMLPEYIVSSGEYIQAPSGTTYGGGLKCCAALWHVATMTAWINLLKAIANRYDTNARFAAICGGETTLGFPDGVSDFTFAAYNTQLRRCYTECKPVFQNTPMRLNANFHGGAADMKSLIDFCHTTAYTGGIIVGGPDPEFNLPLPVDLSTAARTITANEVFRGNSQVVISGQNKWTQGGGTDYRGVIPWVGEQQEFGLGVRFSESIEDIWAYQGGTVGAQNVQNASYMIWIVQNYVGTSSQQWNYMKSYIEGTINGAVPLSNPAVFEGSWA